MITGFCIFVKYLATDERKVGRRYESRLMEEKGKRGKGEKG
jgi:hypothetical protein